MLLKKKTDSVKLANRIKKRETVNWKAGLAHESAFLPPIAQVRVQASMSDVR